MIWFTSHLSFIISYHHLSAIYHLLSSFIIIYHHLSAIYHHVSSFISNLSAIYHHLSAIYQPFIIMYHCIIIYQQFIIIYHHLSAIYQPFIIIYQSFISYLNIYWTISVMTSLRFWAAAGPQIGAHVEFDPVPPRVMELRNNAWVETFQGTMLHMIDIDIANSLIKDCSVFGKALTDQRYCTWSITWMYIYIYIYTYI